MLTVPDDLKRLRQAFQKIDRDIRFVGGCVRDVLAGLVPKDVDLCTDASLDEMRRIAAECPAVQALYETGADHGTLSFRLESDVYEITCLRAESGHDGRHAVCTYGRDWLADLGRRDLTINAMSMDFDGNLYDPFGGHDDLKAGRVRFVGDATRRMSEDYLRILRWLRFHARYGKGPLDFTAMLAAQDVREGLSRKDVDGSYVISRERVWQEMQKIVTGPRAGYILFMLVRMGLDEHIDMSSVVIDEPFHRCVREETDAVTRIVALFEDPVLVDNLAAAWKWSRDEREKAWFLAWNRFGEQPDYLTWIILGKCSKEWAIDLAILRGDAIRGYLHSWNVPKFPLRGQDFLDLGWKPGPQIGHAMDYARMLFAQHRGCLTKEMLLEAVTSPQSD